MSFFFEEGAIHHSNQKVSFDEMTLVAVSRSCIEIIPGKKSKELLNFIRSLQQSKQ
jgi:hypothetical protein